ncbi:prefoldin subunit 3-like [Watersipora subatra]|uniref:prefoldin subunit 3-like n=1 Tax=Watersipora subatra TaxID=2589382 RepID=UPI00355AFA68
MMADQQKEEKSTNQAGIPKAVFVANVEKFMQESENETAEKVLRSLDEQYQKYKFMEQNLTTKKRRLKAQIPDIKGTLETVQHLMENSTETVDTQFLLADNLYVKAKVPPTDRVGLWLGANIMLEYSLEEAQALLEKNLSQAKSALDVVEDDLGFLRDQSTTIEVSMARVYNWDVKRRQQSKAAAVTEDSET